MPDKKHGFATISALTLLFVSLAALVIERIMNNKRIKTGLSVAGTVEKLIKEFEDFSGTPVLLDQAQISQLEQFVGAIGAQNLKCRSDRDRILRKVFCEKLKANEGNIKGFIDTMARQGIVFDYRDKLQIANIFNSGQPHRLSELLHLKMPDDKATSIVSVQQACSDSFLEELLQQETKATLNRRTKVREEEGVSKLLLSALGAFFYSCFDEKLVHMLNDPLSAQDYRDDYWERLVDESRTLVSRECSLAVEVFADGDLLKGGMSLGDKLRSVASEHFDKLSNHGYVAVILEGSATHDWSAIEDFILFSERAVGNGKAPRFHRGRLVSEEMRTQIADTEHFESVEGYYSGFLFKDCFVVGDGASARSIVLLQKNVPDETLLPCPACRSHNVRGNSYSSLGVKSWECSNWICPDRSRSNRGRRYSFLSLLKQRGLAEPENQIERESVRFWSRDIVQPTSFEKCLEMLIRHYSLVGDGVSFRSSEGRVFPKSLLRLGRKIYARTASLVPANADHIDRFDRFRSIYLNLKVHCTESTARQVFADDLMTVIHGDARNALELIGEATVDGAVTSPPYYNARDYAQWPNIYSHMADMMQVAKGVYRTLKPGSYYLYNVFNYFDNDMTVVGSAMGDRRISLSSYTSDAFREVGFELVGNMAWDKGEIEGKRAFNGGNFTPYYQAPFNCWEHILLFRKPGDGPSFDFPRVWKCPPVKKMFGGVNRHGHTAPFPDQLPELLIEQLSAGSTVIDPFAGSLTTGRVARRYSTKSICIERSLDYCKLGLQMVEEETISPALI